MIHVITAVHNRYKITEHFIQSLLVQSYTGGIHLVLVDDGSTDGTSEKVRELMPDATIICGDGNLWWGGALHEAYKWVLSNLSGNTDEYVLISNDDVMYNSDYFEKAVTSLKTRRHTLLTGIGYDIGTGEPTDTPQYYNFYSKKVIEEHNSEKIDGIWYKGDHCSTRSLWMRVEDMLQIGGFHPVLLPHYGSDYEWTYRAYRKKLNICADQDLSYEYDTKTTGDNFYEKLTLRKVFSKRSVTNPIYRINYILMITPFQYLGRELGRQIVRYAKKMTVIKSLFKNNRN